MEASEHKEQVGVITWWALASGIYRVPNALLMAIPNGGSRDTCTGAMLKAEGVRAGAPDLFLAIPKNGKSGLFIEMKRQNGGVVSNKQKYMSNILSEAGYEVVICHGMNAAIEAIKTYMQEVV